MKKAHIFSFLTFCTLSLLLSNCKNEAPAESTNQPTNESTNQRINESPQTLTINNLTWLTENLNEETPNSRCYNDTPSYCTTYGRLYTWEDANNLCKGLGEGWRLPNIEDWTELVRYHGGEIEVLPPNQFVSAFKKLLKDGESGLNVVRGGAIFPNGLFADLGDQAYIWTSSESPDHDDAYQVIMFQGSTETINTINFGANQGASCRCVRE